MSLKPKLLVLIVLPPAAGLALAAALGWIRLASWPVGVGLVVGVILGWSILLWAAAALLRRRQGKEPPGPCPGTVYQPPPPPADFVGRGRQLKRLAGALKPGVRAGVVGRVSMGGLGRTDLARAAVYRAARRFPDGVLWADLAVANPAAHIDRWAVALGVERLPGSDLPDRIAAWRRLAGGKALLLVLDDLQPEQDVEPLLPPGDRAAVLITTRHADHPALHSATIAALAPFTRREARALAREVLGGRVVRRDAARTFNLLGYLPMSVSIALHLARDKSWTLAHLNEQLEAAGAVPVQGRAEHLPTGLLAAFETAWESLSPELQETFSALVLFNAGASFNTAALAAALALEEAEAGDRLGRLAGLSLLTWVGEDRWALHSLLREFAEICPPVEEVAATRMAAHYAGVARAADELVRGGGAQALRGLAVFEAEWPHIQEGQAWAAAHAPESEAAGRLVMDYADAASGWLSLRLSPQERIAWLDAAAQAARRLGDKAAAGRHLGALGLVYADRGDIRQAIAYYQEGLALAREVGGAAEPGSAEWSAARRSEGNAFVNLGLAYTAQGETQWAIEYYKRAVAIARDLGAAFPQGSPEWSAARRDEGARLGSLGLAYAELGDTWRAIGYYQQALAIAREMCTAAPHGSPEWSAARRGAAARLGGLALAYRRLGQVERAVEHLELALAIHREVGDRRNAGATLGDLGLAYAELGESRRAIEYYTGALAIAREIGAAAPQGSPEWTAARHDEATHSGNLAVAYAEVGQIKQARAAARQALVIFEQIDSPYAERARQLLAQLE